MEKVYPEGYRKGDKIIIRIGCYPDYVKYVFDDATDEYRLVCASQMSNDQQEYWFGEIIHCDQCSNEGYIKSKYNDWTWCLRCPEGEAAIERSREEEAYW